MHYAQERIQILLHELKQASVTTLESITNVEYTPCGYKTDNTPPTEGWMPYTPGQPLQGRDSHCWFRAAFRTPAAVQGCSWQLKVTTGYENAWEATNPQCLIWLNGKIVQALDTRHTEVYLEPDTDYVLHNYFYIGMIETRVTVDMTLQRLNEAVEQLYYDLKVPLDCCALLDKQSQEYISMMAAMNKAVNVLDLRQIGSEAFLQSVKAARAVLSEELYGKLCTPDGKPIVNCIGHTHIDVEWLWHRDQTREKIQRSFATAMALMKKYPEYRFMLSQPELYRYLKEETPELYDRLKQLVAEGRWEPEGAMYVESDCNLISGESLIRQIVHGKRFFRQEFGVDCKMLFLPDVFGYSCAMPQVLTKCGLRHFVTSKISWNDTNTVPYDTFFWEGLDGTQIFTNFITTQDYNNGDAQRITTYVGHLTPSEIKGTWNRYLQKEYNTRTVSTFGYGDGGGGPTKDMLETQRRLAKGLPGMPVTEQEFLLPHLDRVRAEFDEGCARNQHVPKWVGELYLEFHRGTYTSIAKNKRGNRKSEQLLQLSEALSATDLLLGGSYDRQGIDAQWKKVLHNQFHDIIPGSSIFEVYEYSDRDYAEIREFCTTLATEKLRHIAENVSAAKGQLVYNALGFARTGTLQLAGKTAELTKPVPAFGWTTAENCITETAVKLDGLTAENKYYRMTLDESGRIARLYDKTADRDVFLPGQKGNELQAFEDFPREYDAWEISDYYKQKQWILDDKAEITPVTDGSRAGFRVSRTYLSSTLTQHIWLYSHCRRIDFENDIDWHEKHQLLKAAFPLDIRTMTATYEVQFGHVSRPTHENTGWDQAKFEVYGHKWVDLSEEGYGVSLLNDCKYGHNTEGSTLKLTLLKCATYPNPEADQGRHLFTYSLLPHTGGFKEAGVIQEGYSLNQPLLTAPITGEAGTLPATFSMVSCNKDNVIVETLKKAEDSDDLIVRLYEAWNRRGSATLTVAPGFSRACLCDMMENELQDLPFDGSAVTLPVGNFEIITVKLVR